MALGVLWALGWLGGGASYAQEEGNVWSDFRADPTLGGRLHFTYRATYDARFYRFHGYRYNFPGDVSDLDRAAAEELESRHRGNRDQDVDQYMSIRTHDLLAEGASSGWFSGLDTDTSLRWFKDIDGTRRGNESFSSYDDFGGREDFQLRTLNATVRLFEEHLDVTIGRQYISDAAEYVHIDGGRVRLRGLIGPFGKPIEIEAFGGQRVAYFDSITEKDVFTDDVWGGTVRYRPARDTEVTISDVHFIDNSLRVELRQSFGPLVDARLAYRQINEDPESVLLEVSYSGSELALELRATYLNKFGDDLDDFNFDYTYSDRVASDQRDHDDHFNIGDLEAFHQLTLEARQGIDDAFGVFVGGTGHWVEDRSNRDQYNTDWYEGWGGVDTLHVPWDGLTGRLTVRYLYTDVPRRREHPRDDPLFIADVRGDGEPSFFGAELLLEQDFARRLSVGTSALWRAYEYESRYADLSDLHAVAVQGYLRWRPSRIVTYSLAYTYERDFRFVNPDFEEVHGVRAQLQVAW